MLQLFVHMLIFKRVNDPTAIKCFFCCLIWFSFPLEIGKILVSKASFF